MGGKSRKTGGVSKKLIQRLVRDQQKKLQKEEDVDKKGKKKIIEEKDEGLGF